MLGSFPVLAEMWDLLRASLPLFHPERPHNHCRSCAPFSPSACPRTLSYPILHPSFNLILLPVNFRSTLCLIRFMLELYVNRSCLHLKKSCFPDKVNDMLFIFVKATAMLNECLSNDCELSTPMCTFLYHVQWKMYRKMTRSSLMALVSHYAPQNMGCFQLPAAV